MDFSPVELLGFVAGAITSMGFIPQLIRGYKTKKLDDVSYFMPAVLVIGMTLWFTFGYFSHSLAVMVANAFGVGCCIILILLKKRYS